MLGEKEEEDEKEKKENDVGWSLGGTRPVQAATASSLRRRVWHRSLPVRYLMHRQPDCSAFCSFFFLQTAAVG